MRRLLLMLSAVWALGSLSAIAQTTTSYSYDALGRLTRVDRSNAAVTYTFDVADNRASVAAYNPFATFWEAESLWHFAGYANGDGWAASTSTVPTPTFIVYGPYTTAVPTGSRVAAYRALIDAPSGGSLSDVVLYTDVYDATAGQVLATQNITRGRWRFPFQYETFELPFTMDASRAGHQIEIRVWYWGFCYARIDKVGYR